LWVCELSIVLNASLKRNTTTHLRFASNISYSMYVEYFKLVTYAIDQRSHVHHRLALWVHGV